METQPPADMPVATESAGPFMVSIGLIMLFAALITFLMCQRQLALKKKPSLWVGIVGSCIAAFITTLFSYEQVIWNGLASYIWNFSIGVLLFILMTAIPSMAVVMERRRCFHRQQQQIHIQTQAD